MSDLDRLKQAHNIEGVADIIDEITTLDKLTSDGDWTAVEQHLQKVSQKHLVEKGLYNIANPYPPTSLQQSAQNCRQFLIGLGLTKLPDIMNQTER